MTNDAKYYAVVGTGRTMQNPSGLVRRRTSPEGRIDEALQRDLKWVPSSAIVEWEYGDVGAELVEISEAEAERLIDRFGEKWGAERGSDN